MKADDRLNNVVKIGYLETPVRGERVVPELPPIEVDITDYGKKDSFAQTYKIVSAEVDREKAIRKAQSGKMGFWESYLWGIGAAFSWLGKGMIFIIFAVTAMWLFGKF